MNPIPHGPRSGAEDLPPAHLSPGLQRSPDLKDLGIKLLVFMMRHDHPVFIKEISLFLGISPGVISRRMNALKRSGKVKRATRDGNEFAWEILPPRCPKCECLIDKGRCENPDCDYEMNQDYANRLLDEYNRQEKQAHLFGKVRPKDDAGVAE